MDEEEGVDYLLSSMEKYEKRIARLLDKQRKHIIGKLKSRIGKDALGLKQLLAYIATVMGTDSFESDMTKLNAHFFAQTITNTTDVLMNAIDKDVAFKTLSPRTLKWIDDWSADLANLMNLSTYDSVHDVLQNGLRDGKSMQKVIRELEQLPEFTPLRARRTAQTEMLTANSRSQWEAYNQSPSVTGKKWKHSGGRGITPRPNHVFYSGTVVGVDENFNIGGQECQYPRDPMLSAKERVNCHCTMGPVVDRNIIKLTPAERRELHSQRLKDMS